MSAMSNEFAYFNDLNDDLKHIVIDKVQNAKDFIRLIASGVPHGLTSLDVQTKLKQFTRQSYISLIEILFTFTQKSLGMERKFMTDEATRTTHIELFLNGYAGTKLLDDEDNFKKYNNTFNDMLFDVAQFVAEAPYDTPYDKYQLFAEIVNKLRLQPEKNQTLMEQAKQVLFKRAEDDMIEHKLVITFESGVEIFITISIYYNSDDGINETYVDASFFEEKTKKKYEKNFTIVGENETGERKINSPLKWIVPFATSMKKRFGSQFVLGNIKNISYAYTGEQFWVEAYMLLDVLPKLRKNKD